jgi:serine protease Do
MDNYNWYTDDYESHIRNSSYRPRRTNKGGGRKVFSYIAVILVTAMLSGAAAGGYMYYKFSSRLDQLEQLAQNTSTAVATYDQQLDTLVAISTTSNTASASLSDNAINAALAKGSSIPAIAKAVSPSVVGIRMVVGNSINSLFNDSSSEESAGEGSGIIIRKDGYILTNYHVVEYADSKNRLSTNTVLEVILPDGRQGKAKFIGGDSINDLAIIKIDLTNLPVAELGDSSKLQAGDLAVAIGNPLGLDFAGSITAGIISALNRSVETEDTVLNLIQTDAAINPGNSGGALVNSQGQVIGINTVKISLTGVEGLGFAIPINDAKPIIEDLIKYGYVKGRPSLGISGREITQTLSMWYDLPKGLYVLEADTSGGAYQSGIRRGDVITSLAGKTIKTMKDIGIVMKSYKAGDKVDAVIVRDGKEVELKVTFTEER